MMLVFMQLLLSQGMLGLTSNDTINYNDIR